MKWAVPVKPSSSPFAKNKTLQEHTLTKLSSLWVLSITQGTLCTDPICGNHAAGRHNRRDSSRKWGNPPAVHALRPKTPLWAASENRQGPSRGVHRTEPDRRPRSSSLWLCPDADGSPLGCGGVPRATPEVLSTEDHRPNVHSPRLHLRVRYPRPRRDDVRKKARTPSYPFRVELLLAPKANPKATARRGNRQKNSGRLLSGRDVRGYFCDARESPGCRRPCLTVRVPSCREKESCGGRIKNSDQSGQIVFHIHTRLLLFQDLFGRKPLVADKIAGIVIRRLVAPYLIYLHECGSVMFVGVQFAQ